MRSWLLVLSLVLFSSLHGVDMKKYQREAEEFSKEGSKKALEYAKNFQVGELTPKEGTPFDPAQACRDILQDQIKETEEVKFLRSDQVQIHLRDNSHLNEDEYFFKYADDLLNNLEPIPSTETEGRYHLETCQEAAEPYPMTVYRTLHVEGNYQPEKKTQTNVCQGHKKKKDFFWKADAKEWCAKKERKLSLDPEVKDHDTDWSGGVASGYTAKATWVHIDNALSCDNYKQQEQVIPERWEETSEKWVYENQAQLSMVSSPDCTLIEQVCVDNTPKNIQGKQVQKQCWKEKLCFLCRFQKTGTCSFLRDKNCLELKRKCLKESPHGCALWEITYKCFDKLGKRSTAAGQNELFGLDINTEYEPNQSFPSVYTKMKIFEEIKEQLEDQNIDDASNVYLFKGKKLKCGKSVADNLLYDCCFSFKGLAKELKLSQCSEEENELSVLREKEQCHYVGKYAKQFMDLWKSQDVHVFCCFSSKLARIFQEQARSQMGLGWGEAKEPMCRGLTASEIESLDFSQLDLSEVYDQQVQNIESKLQQKFQDLNKRLQEKMDRGGKPHAV
jgi:conjugal transfer mating pair stabilization protein TraN